MLRDVEIPQFWQNRAGQVQLAVSKRQGGAAGQFPSRRVHAEPVGAVGRQDNLVVQPSPDKAQLALARVQPALSRAHLALNLAVLAHMSERVPQEGGHRPGQPAAGDDPQPATNEFLVAGLWLVRAD